MVNNNRAYTKNCHLRISLADRMRLLGTYGSNPVEHTLACQPSFRLPNLQQARFFCFMSYTIVGVIGHIDHGKTSLVAALTGVDTDTHPEEKRRGITIDLGFASFQADDYQFALIDAPGHQKYIGNLLAGVSGIDIGLLVVACDQGIQEQTLEHASILQTLGVKKLIVALSRIDLASEEAQETLAADLEVFLDDCGFTDVPMIRVSSVKKTGLDTLRQQLCTFADAVPTRPIGSFFRMPVDRVFSMPGRGCVIAGTVWTGVLKTGDTLQLANSEATVRVREIEVHGEEVEESKVGHRTALNVTGVSANEVTRGDELVQPDVFARSSQLLLEVRSFADAPELKCPATVQLHIAATSCTARITGVRRLSAGTSAVVVIETGTPVVATYGQRCLLRLPYPVGTVGGATVLATVDGHVKRARKLIELGEKLAMLDPADRLAEWVDFLGEVTPTDSWFELQLGIEPADIDSAVAAAIEAGRILKLPKTLASTATIELIKSRVVAVLSKLAEESADAWAVEESVIRQLDGFGSTGLVRRTLQELIDAGKLVRLGKVIAVASDKNALSKKQQKRMELIVAMFEENRSPPALKDIAEKLQLPLETVTSLSRFAVQTGILLDMTSGLLLSAQVFRELCCELQELFDTNPERSVADIRDRWQVTRKHAIPYLEYCDQNKVTARDENIRRAGEQLGRFTT